MIIAHFIWGPLDTQFLVLPTEKPWPKFVVPKGDTLVIPYFYLLAGQHDENTWNYLYDPELNVTI